uniref:Uncharacterized protein n=1 Tax=Arundo donax TaxID=35708 RepID=A0A0A8Z652_ARUDO
MYISPPDNLVQITFLKKKVKGNVEEAPPSFRIDEPTFEIPWGRPEEDIKEGQG